MKSGYIYIKDNIFESLFALSSEEQQKGLMFEENPKIMSFVYSSPKINQFWMKNTPRPLDIAFCLNNKITQICYGEPFSTATIGKYEPSDLVVELPHGTLRSLGAKTGDMVGIVKSSMAEIRKFIL